MGSAPIRFSPKKSIGPGAVARAYVESVGTPGGQVGNGRWRERE
jgi:hypothetical protein